ncbi:MAG: hypothetical protein M3Z21_01540 [Pseudomonadota bacterium]|nr:hypothetical protein [Pseudomonadota bacterium]
MAMLLGCIPLHDSLPKGGKYQRNQFIHTFSPSPAWAKRWQLLKGQAGDAAAPITLLIYPSFADFHPVDGDLETALAQDRTAGKPIVNKLSLPGSGGVLVVPQYS